MEKKQQQKTFNCTHHCLVNKLSGNSALQLHFSWIISNCNMIWLGRAASIIGWVWFIALSRTPPHTPTPQRPYIFQKNPQQSKIVWKRLSWRVIFKNYIVKICLKLLYTACMSDLILLDTVQLIRKIKLRKLDTLLPLFTQNYSIIFIQPINFDLIGNEICISQIIVKLCKVINIFGGKNQFLLYIFFQFSL